MENGTMRLNTFYLFDSKGTNISSHDEDDFNGWKMLISKKKEDHTIWIEEYGKFTPKPYFCKTPNRGLVRIFNPRVPL